MASYCISFLLLLQQITKYLGKYNYTHLLSWSSGCQKCKTGLIELKSKWMQDCVLLEAQGNICVFSLFSFQSLHVKAHLDFLYQNLLHFRDSELFKNGVLVEPYIEQVYQYHLSNSICPLNVSVLYFGISHSISSPFHYYYIFIVLYGQRFLMLYVIVLGCLKPCLYERTTLINDVYILAAPQTGYSPISLPLCRLHYS